MKIFTIASKKEEKFLRTKTADFDFDKANKKEIQETIKKMRKIMNFASGIGLSANQIGLNLRLFVAQLPEIVNSKHRKFYAVFNPKITKPSKKKIVLEEGCLSVPEAYGLVERSDKITLIGNDKNGRKIKIKADGLLARVFQHETDHLNGILFIDRTKDIRNMNHE